MPNLKPTPDAQAAVASIIESIEKAREEAHQYTLVAPHMSVFVVCFNNDFTPFRTNGTEIRVFGGAIWSHRRQDVAVTVANQLSFKRPVGRTMDDVIAMNGFEWGHARVVALNKMLVELRASQVQA